MFRRLFLRCQHYCRDLAYGPGMGLSAGLWILIFGIFFIVEVFFCAERHHNMATVIPKLWPKEPPTLDSLGGSLSKDPSVSLLNY